MKTVTFNQLGRMGRLGNQMFQIASTIGIADRNGYNYAFPYWKNYDHLERFGTSEDIDVQRYFVNHLPLYTGPKVNDSFVHWGYWPVRLTGNNISLNGHMQSEKYFAHCRKDILHYFKMVDEYQQNDYCAIHVRLGDYDDNYHPRLKMDYYKAAMSRFPKDTHFAVFSDDLDEARKMFAGYSPFDVSFCANKNTLDAFKLMKSFKHFIIGNSTYSWWAAWLSNQQGKRVIAPSTWFGAVAKLSAQDIYCKGWEVI